MLVKEYMETFVGKTVVKESVYIKFLEHNEITYHMIFDIMNQARKQILPRGEKMKKWFGAMSLLFDEFWAVFSCLEDKKDYFPDGIMPTEGNSSARANDFFVKSEKIQSDEMMKFNDILKKLNLKN